MAETNEQRIARLLEKGLELYGDGDIAKAILTWEEVLVLDPANADARDYIKTADRRARPRPQKDPGSSPAVRAIASEARQLMAGEHMDSALELLASAAEGMPAGLEIQALLDLVRARLVARYRGSIGDTGAVPTCSPSAGDLRNYNLPSEAGFLLSMVDGSTSVADLISLSGMDDFEALRLLHGLREAGIVEMNT
ncbi:MAG: hypothetical protein ACQGVK_05165 [Myxococcota bacterium]